MDWIEIGFVMGKVIAESWRGVELGLTNWPHCIRISTFVETYE